MCNFRGFHCCSIGRKFLLKRHFIIWKGFASLELEFLWLLCWNLLWKLFNMLLVRALESNSMPRTMQNLHCSGGSCISPVSSFSIITAYPNSLGRNDYWSANSTPCLFFLLLERHAVFKKNVFNPLLGWGWLRLELNRRLPRNKSNQVGFLKSLFAFPCINAAMPFFWVSHCKLFTFFAGFSSWK